MNDDELKLAFDDLLRRLPALGALPERTAVRVRRRRATRLAGLGTAAVLAVVGGVALALPDTGPDRVAPPAAPTRGPSVAPSTSAGPTPAPAPPAPLPSPIAPSPTTTSPTTPSPTTTSPTTAPSAPSTGAASPPVAAPATVVLQGEGLGLASGSSTRPLTFADATATAVREALGRSLGDSTENSNDCGAVFVQYDGLVIALRGERFVGWTVPQTSGLTTADGLGTGTTLAELRDARPGVQVRQGLGTEWTSGDLAGFLDGTQDSSRVTGLYSGDVCLAR